MAVGCSQHMRGNVGCFYSPTLSFALRFFFFFFLKAETSEAEYLQTDKTEEKKKRKEVLDPSTEKMHPD